MNRTDPIYHFKKISAPCASSSSSFRRLVVAPSSSSRGRWHGGAVKSAAPLSVPRRVRSICFIYSFKYCFYYLQGDPAGPPTQTSLGHVEPLLAMLAPFFALERFLGSLCASCCVGCRAWPIFVRLGALQARFWKGSGLVLEGFLVGLLG